MKNIYKLLGLSMLASVGFSSAMHAEIQEYTIDFESYLTEDGVVYFDHLESLKDWSSSDYDASLHRVTTQYEYQFGLTISAFNADTSAEEAWIFDTNDASAGSRGLGTSQNDGDSDLAGPNYINGTKDFGNVLVVQEDPVSYAFPDDEGRESTGILLEWDKPVLFNELTVLDIERPGRFEYIVYGLLGEEKTISASGVGDHSYEELAFDDDFLTQKVELIFKDSGGLGEFTFSIDSTYVVPEPSTVAFLALSGLGFVVYRRRKS